MFVCLRVLVLFRQSEVEQIYYIGSAAKAGSEIVGLQVSVDEAIRVDVLDAGELVKTMRRKGIRLGQRS